MSESSLKQKTIGALLWNLLDRMGQQVLLFIVGILVANILSVEDYALVGMLAIFSAIANIIQDSGFSAALIQKKETTAEEFRLLVQSGNEYPAVWSADGLFPADSPLL